MTIAGRRSATELGLRPASRSTSRSAPTKGGDPGGGKPAHENSGPAPGRLVPLLLFTVALLIGIARIAGPSAELYPIEGDSAKYSEIAQGFATLYSHPLEGLGLWFSHHAGPEQLQRFHFDNWVLQHAPAYTAYLGIGYLLSGNNPVAGRFLTVLLFAAGVVFLYLIAREFFGKWAALAAGLFYLFWPANWSYAPAILTEVPVATAALAATWALMRTSRSTDRRAWIAGGIAIGILVLTKTTLRFIAIPWILIEVLIDRPRGKGWSLTLRRAGYRVAGWGGVWILWIVFLWGFNLSPNPLAKSGDDWLWIYRGDYVPDRGWESVGIGDAYTPELIAAMDQTQNLPADRQKGEMYKKAFFETLRRDPDGMLNLFLSKAGIFWRFPAVKTFQSAGPISLPPPARVQPALAIAALFGLALCIGANGRRCVPAVFPIYLTLLHAATHLVSRYNAPAFPFAFLYAMGALGIVVIAIRRALVGIRLNRGDVVTGLRAHGPPIGFALAGWILCFVLLRATPGSPRAAAPWIAGAGSIPLLARVLGRGRLAFVRAAVVTVPLCLIAGGSIASDTLPGQTAVRLSRPGDGVRVELELPPDARPESFTDAEILVDLLPSERGRMTLSVRLAGKEIARMNGRPPSGPEAFLLDAQVHAADDRYKKVLRSVDRHLNGFVRRHRGMESAGYDYYRQWYRIPVDPNVAFAGPSAVIEIVLVDAQGGSCDVFLDRGVAAGSPGGGGPVGRTIRMPAFFVNPYELSSYRFDALSSDRVLADSRLTRPVMVRSTRIRAERTGSDGKERSLDGEPRIRLRGRVPGGYGFVQKGSNAVPDWVSDPAKARRMLEPNEIRVMQADRDRYFDGFITF
jgi:4-amino-4-deoxy-L-arabinose transferase-like glycosyltransferase